MGHHHHHHSQDPNSNVTLTAVKKAFPDALTNAELVAMVSKRLSQFGYHKYNTLLATSLCSDEVTRPLEQDFGEVYGKHFTMGGLAGFPFGGLTGFGAMAGAIPDGGSCLLIYGSHVGVSWEGKWGTVARRGREKGGACCGSAVAAAQAVTQAYQATLDESSSSSSSSATSTPVYRYSNDPLDAQQGYVRDMLRPYAATLSEAEDVMVTLPVSVYDAQQKLVTRILDEGSNHIDGDGQIAVVGGIQINTPKEMSDFFVVRRFCIRDSSGNMVENFMPLTAGRE
uniref:PtLCIB4 H88A mutant n=1 Tax=Phaeodactylum tricornutum TaxID=2850 RepID=UPI000905D993|nr:Chain A, PtLCIB4 H88A mutant [Phaeodactylum tricornutum]5B5Z_B Chain B, PtLCIB4 H88A mutant [Phaeodactylum tricornutum]